MIHIIISSRSHDLLFPNTEAPKVPNNMQINLYCLLISYFTVSLTLSIDAAEVY